MKTVKRLLSFALVLAMALNFLAISSSAELGDGNGLTVEFKLEAGKINSNGDFVPLAPGEAIKKDDIITIRSYAKADYLTGAHCYVWMYDKEAFTIVGLNAACYTGNPDNIFVTHYSTHVTGTHFIPSTHWPKNAGFTMGEHEDHTVYNAHKAQFQVSSNATAGGVPGPLDDPWLMSYQLQANKDLEPGTARVWMDSRWYRTDANRGGQGYIPKYPDPNVPCSLQNSGAANNYDFEFDCSQADLMLPLPALPTSEISFNTDGGTAIDAVSGDVGADVPTIADPVKEGYDFVGWDPAIPATFPENDLEVTALWQIKKYDITFELDNGNPDVVVSTNHGSMPVAPTPSKAHHTFVGWEPELAEATADATYKALWDPDMFEVFFYGFGGTPTFTVVDTPYGETPVAPTVTRDGYNFLGWMPDLGPVDEDGMEYYARWEEIIVEPDDVTVSFNTVGGSAIADIVGEVGSPFPAISDPVREGYTFKGWSPELPAVFPEEDTSYTAQWEINKYDVTFVLDNGDANVVVSTNHGALPVAPTGFEKEGYNFLGWDSEVVAATGTATYTAQWAIKTYTITFDATGGLGGEGQTVDHGVVPTPPTVTKEGYTFDGWDPEVVAATEDAVYSAQWELNSYEITFVFDNGDDDVVVNTNHGALPVVPTGFTKEGYTFQGWDAAIVAATGEATYTAQWEINKYDITFVLDNGDANIVVSTNHGALPVAPTGFTKDGYTFLGWDADLVAATGVATYTAQWEEIPANMSTITFNTDGGSAVAPLTGEVGETVPAVADPVKEGYTFLGWNPALPGVFPEESVTLTAQWEINKYDITFVLDNGDANVVVATNHGALPVAPTGFTKEGYTFQGWDAAIVAATGEATYTAQWEINKYDVTFVLDNGEDDVVVSTNHGALPEDPTGFTKEGYTFLGWDAEVVAATGEATYTAQWEINKYDITFVLDNGSDDVVVATNHGAFPVVPTGFEKEGYNFLGWDSEVVAATGEATYTAQWKLKGYQITFVLGIGEDDVVIDVDHGDIPAIADPVREGYTFLGWDPEVVVATENASYAAKWMLNSYEITFVLGNGEDDVVVSTDHGALPVAPTVTKEGYDFVEWTPELSPAYGVGTYTAVWAVKSYTITFVLGKGLDDVTVDYDYGTMPVAPDVPRVPGWQVAGWTPELDTVTGAASYTAVWEEKDLEEYTINFDPNGGEGGGEQIVEEGQMPTLPADPVREGYIFMGWGNVVAANGDATYKAKWLGDINGDGEITSLDALLALKHVTGEAPLTEDQLVLADVNGDGRITALDALILLQFVSGKLTELPYLTFG